MNIEIVISNWNVITKEDKSKTVAGEYQVNKNGKEVAKQSFNDGYNNTPIAIPAEIMVKLEAIDKEIKKAIVDNFEK